MKLLKNLFKQKNSGLQNSNLEVGKKKSSAADFRVKFRKNFIPFLKKDNWKGSGFKFYKQTENETVYLLQVVPEKDGSGFSIALAIHFDFITYRFADNIKDYSHSGLDIRGGLPTNSKIYEYPITDSETNQLFNKLKVELDKAYSDFFNKLGNWQEYYNKFTPQEIERKDRELDNITNSRLALLCARIFNHTDNYKKSLEMAEYGLTTINYPTGNGSALYPEFTRIIQAANNV